MKEPKKEKKTIGWEEWVGLPGLRTKKIKAKVDTGATTSCIWATDIGYHSRAGKNYVTFSIHPLPQNKKYKVWAKAELVGIKNIKSSNGQVEKRPVIKTTAHLFDIDWEIEVSLTNRANMGFPMLLGRKALRGQFLIDPSKKLLASKKVKSKKTTTNKKKKKKKKSIRRL